MLLWTFFAVYTMLGKYDIGFSFADAIDDSMYWVSVERTVLFLIYQHLGWMRWKGANGGETSRQFLEVLLSKWMWHSLSCKCYLHFCCPPTLATPPPPTQHETECVWKGEDNYSWPAVSISVSLQPICSPLIAPACCCQVKKKMKKCLFLFLLSYKTLNYRSLIWGVNWRERSNCFLRGEM